MQTSSIAIGQAVEFYGDHGSVEEGVVVEGVAHRAISGCTINKYSNGSMGTWGPTLRVRYEMSHPDGRPRTDRSGRVIHGIKTVALKDLTH